LAACWWTNLTGLLLRDDAGGIINLAKELPGAFSSGTVYCPLPEAVCPTTSCGATGCGPNADCWQGSCKCHLGYAGMLANAQSKHARTDVPHMFYGAHVLQDESAKRPHCVL